MGCRETNFAFTPEGLHANGRRLAPSLRAAVLRKHTWFTEGATGANVRNPGGIGEGLRTRFGVNSCLLELNANWIAGLNAPASAQRWKLFGVQLCEALYPYFDARE